VAGVFDGAWGSASELRAVVLCAGGWGEHAVAAFITVSRRVGGPPRVSGLRAALCGFRRLAAMGLCVFAAWGGF